MRCTRPSLVQASSEGPDIVLSENFDDRLSRSVDSCSVQADLSHSSSGYFINIARCVSIADRQEPHTPGAIVMAAFADFDLTDRQRVDKRILHWSGTTRLFQIGMTIEKPCVTRTLVTPRVAADRSPARAQVSALLARWTGSCEGALLRRPRTRAGARLADSTAGFTCRPAVAAAGARSKRLSRCSPPTCEERGATLCDCGTRPRAAA